jgi:hypothetical protein
LIKVDEHQVKVNYGVVTPPVTPAAGVLTLAPAPVPAGDVLMLVEPAAPPAGVLMFVEPAAPAAGGNVFTEPAVPAETPGAGFGTFTLPRMLAPFGALRSYVAGGEAGIGGGTLLSDPP